MGSRTTQVFQRVRGSTLCQLESCFGPWLPENLFPKAPEKANSRDRHYTCWRTFWCALWQSFNPGASGREVVRQLQALFRLEGGPELSQEDGAYCRARGRLPLDPFPKALAATAKCADQLARKPEFLAGRPVKAADGSALTLLADTESNRTAYPVLAFLQTLGVDFIGRTTRRIDGRRRLRRQGHNDWLIEWKKGATPSPWLTLPQGRELPAIFTLRAVKGSLYQKGFRVRQVTVITTLLDAKVYPPEQILLAYLRRWHLEMCLDDLKTTLQMDGLRSRSPEMAQKELYPRLIAHNLIRCTMAQASAEHDVPLDRISFKGSLDAVRQFSHALARAKSKHKRAQLWNDLLRTLAADLVPERPGRREPRAVKRKKNRYPRLVGPRRQFRDHLKRHDRGKISRPRKAGLM